MQLSMKTEPLQSSKKTEPLISPSSNSDLTKLNPQNESKRSLLPKKTRSAEQSNEDVIVDLSETNLSQIFDAYESDNENNSDKISLFQKGAQYVYRCQQGLGYNGLFFNVISTKLPSYLAPGINAGAVSGFDYLNTHVLSHMLKQVKPVTHIQKVDHNVHILTAVGVGGVIGLTIGISDYKTQWCHDLSICADPVASNLTWGPIGLAIKALIAWRVLGDNNNPKAAKTKNLSYKQRFFNELMRVPNAFAVQNVILGLVDSFMLSAPMHDFGFKFVMITGSDVYHEAFSYLAFTPSPLKTLADRDQINNQVPVERLTAASHIPQTNAVRESFDSTIQYPTYSASIAYAIGKEIVYKGTAMLSTYGLMYAAEGRISPHWQQSASLCTYIVLDNLIRKAKPIAKGFADCASILWRKLPCVKKSMKTPLLNLTPGKASLNSI